MAWAWGKSTVLLGSRCPLKETQPNLPSIFCWNILGVEFKKEKIYIYQSFLRPGWQSLICPSHFCVVREIGPSAGPGRCPLKDPSHSMIPGGQLFQRALQWKRRVPLRGWQEGGATGSLHSLWGGRGKAMGRGSCVEGFYFGKAVQKIIQNVAVKRENQTLSVKKNFTSTN